MSFDNDYQNNRRQFLKLGGGLVAAGMGGVAGCTGGDGGGGTTEPTEATTPDGSTESQSEEEQLIEQANPPEEIVAVDFPVVGMERVYYAMENGLFEKRGLNFSLTDSPIFGASRGFSAVASGNADISSTNSASGAMALAREQDYFMKMVYPDSYLDPEDGYPGQTWIVSQGDSSISSVEDLEGTSVSVLSGSTIMPASVRWHAEQVGIDPSSISFQYMPPNEIAGSVARGDVDAGCPIEPAILAAESEGLSLTRVAPLYEYLGQGTFDGYWVSPEFAEQHPDTVKLLQYTFKEVNQIMVDEGVMEVIGPFASDLGTNEDILSTMFENGYGYKPYVEFETPRPAESLANLQDIMVNYGDVATSVDTSNFFLSWDK